MYTYGPLRPLRDCIEIINDFITVKLKSYLPLVSLKVYTKIIYNKTNINDENKIMFHGEPTAKNNHTYLRSSKVSGNVVISKPLWTVSVFIVLKVKVLCLARYINCAKCCGITKLRDVVISSDPTIHIVSTCNCYVIQFYCCVSNF